MIYDDYMARMKTMNSLKLGHSGNRALLFIIFCVMLLVIAGALTPWIQTAQGWGRVSTINAQDRTQAISALVPGIINKWHVREGQRVKAGEAIVTLADMDPELLIRLQAKLSAIEHQRQANEIAVMAAEQEYDRKNSLAEQGISSIRERDEAQIKLQEARTKLAATDAQLTQARTLQARQSTQTKRAPTDGIVTRLLGAGMATSVRAGDILAQFIPDNVERSVVVEVNGLDAPLIQPGRKVRLQFEGWPVFQFSGWPSKAIGTFGGVVDFVEPVANANGMFNVWIEEDPADNPWPNSDFVRLGSNARGWVLLEEVRLGYEIWRQLNNFPPKYSQPQPETTAE